MKHFNGGLIVSNYQQIQRIINVMVKQDVKVSVIVPVYNVAPYLERCLNSLIGQTLHDIEIICVDDASTDNSLEILHQYAARDSRVHVIALGKNSGVATARNAGIDAACGEYLGFVDSDDFVDTNFYEKLYARAHATNADITVSNIRETALNGRTHTLDGWLKRVAENKLNFDYTLWCAIYRTDFIRKNKIYNPAGVITGQDAVFIVNCAVLARNVATVPDAYYNYIRRDGSLWQQIQPPVKIKSRVTAIRMICEILNNADLSPTDYIKYYTYWHHYLQTYIERNTSILCRQMIADAMIDLYKACKDKTGFIREYAKCSPGVIGAEPYLASEDSDGLLKCLTEPQKAAPLVPAPAVKYNHTFYLFALLPLVRLRRAPNHTIIRVFGLKIYERKQSPSNLRVLVMYIPVIRIKSK